MKVGYAVHLFSFLQWGNGAMPGAALSGKLRRVVFITMANRL